MKRFKQFSILITLSVFVFSTIITTLPVMAANELCDIPDPDNPNICLDGFYGGNDILYYDPNALRCGATPAASGGNAVIVGNSNAEKIFLYLTGKGLTGQQAAGVLGNFQQESGFDPAIIQGGAIADENYTPVNEVGFGIAQWTFTDRQAPLMELAKSSGRSITDLGLQLDFLWQELNTTHKRALETLKAAPDPEPAAFVFHRDFEGSADSEAFVIEVRGGNARVLYERFKNLAPATTTSTPTATADECNAETALNTGSGTSDFLSKNFTIYNQCSFAPYGGPWGDRAAQSASGGTICAEGCIPTSLAMIAKNLAGLNITPDDTVNYYNAAGLWNAGGPGSMVTSPMNAASNFKMRIEPINDKGNIAAYKAVFDKGGLVMAISTGSSPFLAGRHAIVIRGITSDGKFMIADPGRRENNESPLNTPSVDKILTDIRGDGMSVSYAFYEEFKV